jgi:hypothetical protein
MCTINLNSNLKDTEHGVAWELIGKPLKKPDAMKANKQTPTATPAFTGLPEKGTVPAWAPRKRCLLRILSLGVFPLFSSKATPWWQLYVALALRMHSF